MESVFTSLQSFFPGILEDVFLAGLTAWMAVRISLKKFSSQRWWERQEDAYTKIVEALSEITYLLEFLIVDTQGAKASVGEEKRLEVWEKLQVKLNYLRRAANIGTFRISAQAVNELNTLFESIYPALPTGDPRDSQDTLGDLKKILLKCQKSIEIEARRDLGLLMGK